MIPLDVRRFLTACRGEGLLVEQLTNEEHRVKDRCFRRGWLRIPYRMQEPPRVQLTRAGEEELVAKRVEKPGRVYCVNPLCGSSSAQERFPGCDDIICGKCFKMAPELRQEYRALWARRRKVERLSLRHGRDTTALARLDMQISSNWRRIQAFFQEPERPEGLEQFLKEIGFDVVP